MTVINVHRKTERWGKHLVNPKDSEAGILGLQSLQLPEAMGSEGGATALGDFKITHFRHI